MFSPIMHLSSKRADLNNNKIAVNIEAFLHFFLFWKKQQQHLSHMISPKFKLIQYFSFSSTVTLCEGYFKIFPPPSAHVHLIVSKSTLLALLRESIHIGLDGNIYVRFVKCLNIKFHVRFSSLYQ